MVGPDRRGYTPGSLRRAPRARRRPWSCLALLGALGVLLLAGRGAGDDPSAPPRPREAVVPQTGHTQGIAHLALAPDGRRAATLGWDRTIRMWDVHHGLLVWSIPAPEGLSDVAFDGGGTRLWGLLGREGYENDALRAWDVRSGELVDRREVPTRADGGRDPIHNGRSLDVRRQGDLAATATSRGVVLWPLAGGGKQRAPRLLPPGEGTRGLWNAVAFAPDGRAVAAGGQGDRLVVHAVPDGRILGSHEEHRDSIECVAWTPDGRAVVSGDRDGVVIVWDVENGRVRHRLGRANGDMVHAVATSGDGRLLAIGTGVDFSVWDLEAGTELRTFRTIATVTDIAFDPQEEVVLAPWYGLDASGRAVSAELGGHDGLAVWSARTGTLVHGWSAWAAAPRSIHLVEHAPDQALVFYDDQRLRRWDLARGQVIASGELGPGPVAVLAVSPDGERLLPLFLGGAAFGADGGLVVSSETMSPWSGPVLVRRSATGETVWTGEGSAPVAMHPSRTWCAHATADGVAVHDVGSAPPRALAAWKDGPAPDERTEEHAELARRGAALGVELPRFPRIKTALGLSAAGDLAAVGFADGDVEVRDVRTGALVHVLAHPAFVTALAFSPDGTRVVTGAMDGGLHLWSTKTGERLRPAVQLLGAVRCLCFGPSGAWLWSAADDGTLRRWQMPDLVEEASFVAIGPQGAAVFLPDGTYMAPRSMQDSVAFRVDGEMYPAELFDLRRNRPDRVLAVLGAPEAEVLMFAEAWRRRCARAGFPPVESPGAIAAPQIQVSRGLPATTRERLVRVPLQASASAAALRRIEASVNGNPLPAVPIPDEQSAHWSGTIEVRLVTGPNRIRLAARDASGALSLRETLDVTCEAPPDRGAVHVLAVGVSRYAEPTLRLTYPAKDAEDVARLFGAPPGEEGEVHATILRDEEVTRDAVLAALDALSSARPEDTVVVFLAGHGFLDPRFHYWYGTHDVDARAPGERGLAYEDLEGRLRVLAARRKLLLLDTCHAGEVDPALEGTWTPPDLPGTRAAAHGVRGPLREPDAPPERRADPFRLAQSWFADLRVEAGVVVVAAAGGLECALESPAWKNGAFTFALREAIESGRADADRDGTITVTELGDYVTNRVPALTRDIQQPAVRQGPVDVDWPLP